MSTTRTYRVACAKCPAQSPEMNSTAEVEKHGWKAVTTQKGETFTTDFRCPEHKEQ